MTSKTDGGPAMSEKWTPDQLSTYLERELYRHLSSLVECVEEVEKDWHHHGIQEFWAACDAQDAALGKAKHCLACARGETPAGGAEE